MQDEATSPHAPAPGHNDSAPILGGPPGRLELIALHGTGGPYTLPEIATAPRWRDWMNSTRKRNANRCLPLLMANEAGWIIKNPARFTAVWDGSEGRDATEVTYAENCPAHRMLAISLFGCGILTWVVPYLFRTPSGFNLLARGPANWPKDGICALDGLVETDWAVSTFTMNWKITRPEHPVTFDEGEPFCMVVPQRRGELASFDAQFRPFESDAAAHRGYSEWIRGRHEMQVKKFLAQHSRDFIEYATAWERNYFKGTYPSGDPAPEHETKQPLREFRNPVSD